MIVWWSVATALYGFTHNVTQLAVVRTLLGLGEGGSFPAAAKVVAERFDPSDRSFAIGIFNTGSSAGAMISAPVIAILIALPMARLVLYDRHVGFGLGSSLDFQGSSRFTAGRSRGRYAYSVARSVRFSGTQRLAAF